MDLNGKRVLVCDCDGTMPLDGKTLARACRGTDLAVSRQLCRRQIETFKDAAAAGRPLLVACTQEVPLFLETLDDMETAPEAAFTNIRERAGWSTEAPKATPKIAALLAEAALDIEPTSSVSLTSEGALLVVGTDDHAIEAAKQAAGRLDVTVLLTKATDVSPPRLMDVPVFTGKIKAARGHLGAFSLDIAGFAPAQPSSRDHLSFDEVAQSGTSTCDLILDLRGGTPLFPAPEKRDGYFNPDPGNPAAVQRALFDLVDLVGTFDKPRYVDFDADLCAHARSGITGCTRCLDVCPAGAIEPAGDSVAIDPYVCAGCGSCASVCPTGAAGYALPAGDGLFRRLRTLVHTYREGGGSNPVLLIHEFGSGDDIIDAIARSGRGLPANVLPFAVNAVTQMGLEGLLGAIVYGANRCVALVNPAKTDEAAGLTGQIDLGNAILDGLGYGADRLGLLEAADPDAVERTLYETPVPPSPAQGDFAPLGRKRALLPLALYQLRKNAPAPVDVLPLPEGAPFGTVEVRVEGCTLCLACVGACPTGALKDNPEKPMLRFREDACVQCGLCKVTCPEKVIAMEPRLSFTDDARNHIVVKEEEPYHCVRCGKEFGTQSSIERMIEKLSGHSMFADPGRLEMLKMCEDCRGVVQFEAPDQPFAGPPCPTTRTTEDYLREREELRKQANEFIADHEIAQKRDDGEPT